MSILDKEIVGRIQQNVKINGVQRMHFKWSTKNNSWIVIIF